MICDKETDKSKHISPDCFEGPADPPMVLNNLHGLRYCGKRALYSMKDAQRPIRVDEQEQSEGGRPYTCPEGTVACNEEWLSSASSVDFVICRLESEDPEDVCPITSLAFKVDEDDPAFDSWEFNALDTATSGDEEDGKFA